LKLKLKIIGFLNNSLNFIIIFGILTCSCERNIITIEDVNGVMGETMAPVSVNMALNKKQRAAAEEGRLVFLDLSTGILIPVQMESTGEGKNNIAVAILPQARPGPHKLRPIEIENPINETMKSIIDQNSGQVIIEEEDKMVLQYNYKTVYEKDVIRNVDEESFSSVGSELSGIYLEEYIKAHPEIKKDTLLTTSIYGVPRSDYIHPLFGLNGEMLTRDWPDNDHPHHRGIFWAWPEVEYGSKRGDIYALQRIFARPTGKIEYSDGAVFAQVVAENYWMWEDYEPIVREHVVIRVYRSSSTSRIIDLAIKFDALKDSITIATRETNSYGGLNLRMQTPDSMKISYFTDETNSKPLRAWSDLNGIFKGNSSVSGLMVLQHKDNPEYPGTWVEYQNLGWIQPTFPTQNTRYALTPGESLMLQYRLIIHTGRNYDLGISKRNWDAFNNKLTPLYHFDKKEE